LRSVQPARDITPSGLPPQARRHPRAQPDCHHPRHPRADQQLPPPVRSPGPPAVGRCSCLERPGRLRVGRSGRRSRSRWGSRLVNLGLR